MAAVDSTALLQGTKVRDEVVRVINTQAPLIGIIPTDAPENPAGPLWNLEKGGLTITYHAEGAAFPAESAGGQYQCSLGWSRSHAKILLTDEMISKGALFGNPGDMRTPKARKLSQGLEDWYKRKQQQFFVGTGANSIIGFASGIADSGTYANVARAGEATFQSTVMSANPTTPGTGAALTKARLRYFATQVAKKTGKRKQDFFFLCPEMVFNKILELYESQVQYQGREAMGALGGVIPSVVFDGMRFVVLPDTDAVHSTDTGTKASLWMIYVNPSNPKQGIHWQTLPYVEDTANEPARASKILTTFPGGVQLIASYEAAHATGRVLREMGQLVVPNPAQAGVLNDINI